jgi:hypothetical protein
MASPKKELFVNVPNTTGTLALAADTAGNPLATTTGSPGQCKWRIRALTLMGASASPNSFTIVEHTTGTVLGTYVLAQYGVLQWDMVPLGSAYLQNPVMGHGIDLVVSAGSVQGSAVLEASNITYGN